MGGGGGCSQRLLSLNPTTVMVVLLLGLWLLLGCDNYSLLGPFLHTEKSFGTKNPPNAIMVNIK